MRSAARPPTPIPQATMLRLEHHGTWASITPESLMPQHLGRDVARFPRQAGALYDRRGFKHRVGFGPRPKGGPGEGGVGKKKAALFLGTAGASPFPSLAINTLVGLGATTSGCIRAPATDGIQYGDGVIVPRGGVGDRARRSHEVTLFD